jgi:hypothetical protein
MSKNINEVNFKFGNVATVSISDFDLAFDRRQCVLFFGSSLDLSFGVDHRLFSAAVFRAMIVEVSAAAIKSSCSQTGQSCLLYCSMLLQLKLLLLLLLLMSLKHVFFLFILVND